MACVNTLPGIRAPTGAVSVNGMLCRKNWHCSRTICALRVSGRKLPDCSVLEVRNIILITSFLAATSPSNLRTNFRKVKLPVDG